MTASSRPISAPSSCWRRSGPQSTRTRSPLLSTRIEVRRRPLRGSAGSHWPHSLPILGTPVDVPQPRILTFKLLPLGLAEQCEEVGAGRLAEDLRVLASQLGDEGGGVGDEGRLAFLAAV